MPASLSSRSSSTAKSACNSASSAFAGYSPALRKSGLTWTPETLGTFLTAPGKLVPGTRMVVMVADAKQRADIIAWLGTQR